MKISILNFSGRKNGNCDAVSHHIAVKFSSFQREVMESVTNSDLAYFIVPNYCGMPCANYYAFNERSVGYFNLDRSKM